MKSCCNGDGDGGSQAEWNESRIKWFHSNEQYKEIKY